MELQFWTVIPFIIILAAIAIAPLFAERVWEKNLNKLIFIAVVSIPTAIYLIHVGLGEKVLHQVVFDYIPFIMLLLALFVVTGGIHVSGNLTATPLLNSIILLAGFLAASIMGTTGAAMLLIRPLLEINKHRKYRVHTVLFFIAMVANCGGILSPLGDPPLFMLYLRGAHFTWFLELLPEWTFVGFCLLVVYYAMEKHFYLKESPEALKADDNDNAPLHLSGEINVIYLFMIMACVICLNPSMIPAMGEEHAPLVLKFIREIALGVIIALSLLTTKKSVRVENGYSWEPIEEVAILFIGIFITMTPALLLLNEHAASLGLTHPWQFYYSTGVLSSFLDNTPTAVAFHTVATGIPAELFSYLSGGDAALVAGIPALILRAIALSAVFFGSMTYIGNGPNFMVKAIAEQEGIKMPSFFGYIFKFSLIILLPVYIIAQLIFL